MIAFESSSSSDTSGKWRAVSFSVSCVKNRRNVVGECKCGAMRFSIKGAMSSRISYSGNGSRKHVGGNHRNASGSNIALLKILFNYRSISANVTIPAFLEGSGRNFEKVFKL